MAAIIAAAGLSFQFNEPDWLPNERYETDERFEFRLMNSSGARIPLSEVSSGERVLMSTVLWRYQAEAAQRHYRLLLLDEPDAHLHPSLTRRFLNVLKKTFVEERGVRVIMTTHSPSTAALTPTGSLFEMLRVAPRIRRVTNSEAIANLTDGFVAVQDATRTVFVEGKSDPDFYKIIWQLLVETRGRNESPIVSPYPAVNFVFGQGRQTVLDNGASASPGRIYEFPWNHR